MISYVGMIISIPIGSDVFRTEPTQNAVIKPFLTVETSMHKTRTFTQVVKDVFPLLGSSLLGRLVSGAIDSRREPMRRSPKRAIEGNN
jgi:hypothetical protein